MKRLLLVAALAAGSASLSSCYGSYSAFNAVKNWNGSVTTNKIARSAIHLGLYIIPVYPLVFLGDWLIFNTIEFATDKPVFGP